MHNPKSEIKKDPYELSVTSEPSVPPLPLNEVIYSAGQKNQLNFANISQTEDRILMKFGTLAHDREMQSVKMCTHTFMPHAHMLLNETLFKIRASIAEIFAK